MANSLTDKLIRSAAPREAAYALADGGGLRIVIQPSGTKSWVLKYKIGRRSMSASLGHFPAMGVNAARVEAASVRQGLSQGEAPAGPRKAARAGETHTMTTMLWSWFDDVQDKWKPSYRARLRQRLQTEVLDIIGTMHPGDVSPKILKDKVLIPFKRRCPDTALRFRAFLDQAFEHAIMEGVPCKNSAAELKKVLGERPPNGLRPAIVDLKPARAMLTAVEAQDSKPSLKLCHRFQALTAVRPGEARQARWEQFEGLGTDEPVWRIPKEQMKMGIEHVVPLSPQAVDVIEVARTIFGKCPFVFPADNRKAPLQASALNSFIGRAGFMHTHCAHGWRSTFSTTMNDIYEGTHESVVEAALAHYKREVAGRYNRGTYLQGRRNLMNRWADELLEGMQTASQLVAKKDEAPPAPSLAIAA